MPCGTTGAAGSSPVENRRTRGGPAGGTSLLHSEDDGVLPEKRLRHVCRYRAFIWRDSAIQPVAFPDTIRLKDLKGYELPRQLAVDNTLAFLEGYPANNCLLYGDRGTGKSSTIKAMLNDFYSRGLRVIEMPKESLMDFPKLVDQIAALPMRFIIFIDDLSFSKETDTYAALKAVLEGGLAAVRRTHSFMPLPTGGI